MEFGVFFTLCLYKYLAYLLWFKVSMEPDGPRSTSELAVTQNMQGAWRTDFQKFPVPPTTTTATNLPEL